MFSKPTLACPPMSLDRQTVGVEGECAEGV